ncbi:MAG: hypothetical protein DIJKHBIC_04281 [Thermoanaerobaculia bacterium]|nr:hypothetical protein [Thermoanaerobaculia bacterium]
MTGKVVAFRAGKIRAAAWTEEVERILPMEELLPAPAAPEHIIGLVRYRSRVLAVVDVAARLFSRGDADELRYLLAGSFGGVPAALAVSEIDGILAAETCDSPDPAGLPNAMKGLLSGAVRAGGEDRVLLDLTRLLEADEAQIVKLARPEP